MDIIVHLTISGMIALHPLNDPAIAYKWRVVVPDLTAHKHVAFFLTQSPAGAGKYDLVPLTGEVAYIDAVTAEGGRSYPEELMTYEKDACVAPAGDCAHIRDYADFDEVPALELWLADAGIAATWIDGGVPWHFERTKKGNVINTLKSGSRNLLAEEICLTFKIPSAPFVLNFSGGGKIELQPNAKGVIELRLQNVELGPGSFSQEDPHFPMNYDLVRRVNANDRARLKTAATQAGTIIKRHEHSLSGVTIEPANVNVVLLAAKKGRPGATALFPSVWGPRSLTGSNCPPIGGGGRP